MGKHLPWPKLETRFWRWQYVTLVLNTELKKRIMLLTLFVITLSCATLSNADLTGTSCGSIVLPSDSFSIYVICKGNFSDIDNLKLYLGNISGLITVFELQDVLVDVLPSDIFRNVSKPAVRKIIFANVSAELLEIPESGDPPFKSVKDTVESFEIYDSPKVFAWDFASLSFKNLKTFIIEDSELISITVPFFFWHELQFVQFQNSNLKWIHPKAFQGNVKLAVCSLAHNRISSMARSMFPKPAAKLYSLDLSFNRLEFLPDDMFTDMNMLHELKLDKNRLKVISMDHLQPVWNNLTQLWLNDNDVRCKFFCWRAGETEMPMFFSSSRCKTSRGFIYIYDALSGRKCPSD